MPRMFIAILAVLGLLWVAPAQAQQLNMVNWTEPNEGAFSLPVPQGWHVEGGMKRVTALDVRPDVLVTSPDGRVLCRMGDAFIQTMVQPNQFMQNLGFGKGRLYSPGYGEVWLVLRYLPGAYYLTQYYLPNRVGQVTNLRAGNLPALSRMSTQSLAQAGIQMQEDAGVVVFNVQTESGPRVGWGYCQTRATSTAMSQGIANWEVRYFYGYLADPAAEPLARKVLAAMVGGLKYNTQWVAGQLRLAGNTAKIIHDTDTKTFEIIQDVIVNRMKVADKAAQEWDRYIRGTTMVRDPTTGREYEAQAGSDQYFLDRNGNPVGAATGDNRYRTEGYQALQPIR